MPTKKTEIDLSKIKNIDAVSKVETDFEEKIVKPYKKKRSGKFQFSEPEKLRLPSGGKLYTDATGDREVLNGFIEVYPMTIKEEEILSTPRFIKSGSSTRMILERCIASDIDAKDLLLFDSNFLLFYLRKISYGDEYNFEITCSNPVCEKKYDHRVKISELEFEELPEDIIEPIIVKLPRCGYTIKTILPRLYHSEDIFKRNQNRKRTTEDQDKRMVDNLMITTIEILDVNNEPVNKKDWEEFFESVVGEDAAELRDRSTFSTGVDEIKNVICPYCDTEYSGTIPIGINFFRF